MDAHDYFMKVDPEGDSDDGGGSVDNIVGEFNDEEEIQEKSESDDDVETESQDVPGILVYISSLI